MELEANAQQKAAFCFACSVFCSKWENREKERKQNSQMFSAKPKISLEN